MINFDNLYNAYIQCRIGKPFSRQQALFEMRLSENLVKLTKELSTKTYKVSPHHYFIITKPKPREIFSAHFRDRVVHHYLVSKLTPIWEKKFTYASFACRVGKGTLGAVKELQKQVHKISCGGTQQVYVLQLDVKSFFCSISRPILIGLLQKHTKDPELKWLINVCIAHDARLKAKNYIKRDLTNIIPKEKSWFSKPSEFGLPIGNLTSQFGANVYLNDLDHFIVRHLKPKSYIRYVDDLTFIDTDKNKLEAMIPAVKIWLLAHREMHLNDSKTKLTPLKNGIKYLGYQIFQTLPSHNEGQSTRILVPKNKKHAFIQKVQFIENLDMENLNHKHPLDPEKPYTNARKKISSINAHLGYMGHANSFEFRKMTIEKLIQSSNQKNKKLKNENEKCFLKIKRGHHAVLLGVRKRKPQPKIH